MRFLNPSRVCEACQSGHLVTRGGKPAVRGWGVRSGERVSALAWGRPRNSWMRSRSGLLFRATGASVSQREVVVTAEISTEGGPRSFVYDLRDQEWCWSAFLRDLLGIGQVSQRGRPKYSSTWWTRTDCRLLGVAGQWEAHGIVLVHLRAARCSGPGAPDCRCSPEHFPGVGRYELSGFLVDITETLHENERNAVEASSVHRASIEQAKRAVLFSFGVGQVPAEHLQDAGLPPSMRGFL